MPTQVRIPAREETTNKVRDKNTTAKVFKIIPFLFEFTFLIVRSNRMAIESRRYSEKYDGW